MPMDILVMGNGFDLWCRLKSRYSDFANERARTHKAFYGELNAYLDNGSKIRANIGYLQSKISKTTEALNSDISFWEIAFTIMNRGNQDPFWQNIENDILEFFNGSGKSGLSFLELSSDVISGFDVFRLEQRELSQDQLRGYTLFVLTLRLLELRSLKNHFNIPSDTTTKDSSRSKDINEKFAHFLLSELNLFERTFSKYINDQVKNVGSYDGYSSDLIENIYRQITLKPDGTRMPPNDIYYLSFNYTLPKAKQIAKNGTNVHGYIGESGVEEDSIIIGIDQDQIKNPSKFEYLFTKTYRKLFLKLNLNSQSLPQKQVVRRIIFFGHSLGKADYSYFYSLFDFYDIGSSNVELVFCFSVYDQKKREIISHQQYGSVTRLMFDYIEKTNGRSGKNLLHRLLLEQRLRIVEIT
jgi:hypothetical protein